jgi:outer membrane protein assembly factor BamB
VVSATGKLPILVNAYDTRIDVASVTGEAGGHRVTLRRTSAWTWTGEMPARASGGASQIFRAEIRATNGETWRAEATFALDPGSQPAALRLKWAAPTGGFIGLSAPRLGEHGVAIGADDLGDLKSCGVAAFDLGGRKRWHFNTDSAIKNNIACARGRIFATSVAGWLYALDESSGELLWKAELNRERARWEIAATTAADGVVYVGALSHIAAFDEKTGRKLWANQQGSLDWSPSSYPIPTVAQDKLLLFHLRWGGFALDARTGNLAWKLDGSFAGVAVSGDTIYTVHNNIPAAFALQSGKLLWTGQEKIGSSGSKPCLAGDRVVIGSSDGRVAAFSTADGRVLWSTKTGPSLTSLQPYARGGSDVSSSPAVHNGKVYVGASDGELHVLALADGARLGRHRLGVPIASSPLITDGTLYVGAYDGNLYAFAIEQ